MNQHERGRAIRRAEGITWRDKVVLWELNDLQGDNDCCWPTQTTVADALGIDVRHVRRAVSKLTKSGWIVRGHDSRGRHTYAISVPQVQEGQSSPITSQKREGQNSPDRAKTARAKTALSTGPKQPGGGGPKQPPKERSVNAQERPECVAHAREAVPEVPKRPRSHPADFAGQPADEARAALNAALKAAGHAPKPRGGWSTQGAWQQVACDAAELAQETGNTVAHVLEVSAAGFVAAKGAGGHPTWWAEDVARYFDEGRKGAPRKRGEMAPIGVGFVGTSDDELEAMFGPLREVQA